MINRQFDDDGLSGQVNYPYGYHIDVPMILREVYSSGTHNRSTISNYFDIEWRRFLKTKTIGPPLSYNNGSEYIVGSSRVMESLAFTDDFLAIEGLIVDTKSGGIGFRNHTVPSDSHFGMSWSEDHLFIEPETSCVDTNLTIDFEIYTQNETLQYTNVTLVDQGGFVNIVQKYPRIDLGQTQTDPKLRERAYKAACMYYPAIALHVRA